jgi:hypothetical protein
MKHKHCDLIKAWADGAQIQQRIYNGEWRDLLNPLWDGDMYRIKPDTIKYRLALIQGFNVPWINAAMSEPEAMNIENTKTFVRWLGDWQEVEV